MFDFVDEMPKRAKKLGISMRVLFILSGVSDSTYARWRNGETQPRMATLRKIDDVFKRLEKEKKNEGKRNTA